MPPTTLKAYNLGQGRDRKIIFADLERGLIGLSNA